MDEKHLSTDALITAMRSGTREVYEIKLRAAIIPVRVLSVDETNAIRREAMQLNAINQGDETDRNLHIQKTTLSLASNVMGVPLLSDALYARMRITVDEVNTLFNEYIAVLDKVNPSLEKMTQEEFRAIVEGLKKNSISENDLSIRQLREICRAYQELIREPATPT